MVKCGCQFAGVCVSYDSGFKGWLDLPLLQQDPVDLSEEGMGLDGLLAALGHHAAQPFGRVLGHELHQTHTFDCVSGSEALLPLFKRLASVSGARRSWSGMHFAANNRARH